MPISERSLSGLASFGITDAVHFIRDSNREKGAFEHCFSFSECDSLLNFLTTFDTLVMLIDLSVLFCRIAFVLLILVGGVSIVLISNQEGHASYLKPNQAGKSQKVQDHNQTNQTNPPLHYGQSAFFLLYSAQPFPHATFPFPRSIFGRTIVWVQDNGLYLVCNKPGSDFASMESRAGIKIWRFSWVTIITSQFTCRPGGTRADRDQRPLM